MAVSRSSYPSMPLANWWALRERFSRTMPSSGVPPGYIATALNMSEQSARNNVFPALRATGLIDEEGRTTERARRWRDDEEYPEVCNEIRSEVYPLELQELFDDPKVIDRNQLKAWFQRETGVGENAATKMASFYSLLLEADPSKKSEGRTRKRPASRTMRNGSSSVTSPRPEEQEAPPGNKDQQSPSEIKHSFPGPELHIDIQIHISPEAGADQIDQIFASMGKHLKSLYSNGAKDDK